MVGNGHFAYADHFIQHHDILHKTAGESGDWNLIGSGVSIGGDAFVLKAVGLCKKGRHISAHSVCADASHHCGDAVHCKVFQSCLGRSGMEPAFASAAQDMFMAVNESGHCSHAFPVYFFCLQRAAEIGFQILAHSGDLISKNKDIFYSGVFRLIYFCVSDDLDHSHICSCLSYYDTSPSYR